MLSGNKGAASNNSSYDFPSHCKYVCAGKRSLLYRANCLLTLLSKDVYLAAAVLFA